MKEDWTGRTEDEAPVQHLGDGAGRRQQPTTGLCGAQKSLVVGSGKLLPRQLATHPSLSAAPAPFGVTAADSDSGCGGGGLDPQLLVGYR